MTIWDGDNPIDIVAVPANVLSLFLVQLCLITILSRTIGKIVKFFNEPMVVAEMIAGILLGPTAFGRIPHFQDYIFPPASVPTLRVIANFGLILFMFLVGLEMDPQLLRTSVKRYSIISTIGVVVPFVASIPVAWYLFNDGTIWATDKATLGNFILFVGIAMGISALPVLARILAERHMLQHKLGVVTMASTAIDDLEGWVLLAIVITLAKSTSSLNILWTFLAAVGNVLLLLFVVRPIFNRIGARVAKTQRFTVDMFFVILIMLISFAFMTEVIGLSAIFGAFEVGCMIPRNDRIMNSLVQKMEDIVSSIFLPIYFTLSGLRTEFGLLDNGHTWGVFFMIFFVAFFSKIIGCAVSSRFIGGLNNREALCFGVLMQTKGLVALVVFNLGLDYGVITPALFSVNVLMVLVSTLLTTPIVERIFPVKKMMEESLRSKGREGAIFVAVLPVSTIREGPLLVTVIEPIIKGRNDVYSSVVEVVHFIQDESVSARTSYLSTWYSTTKNYFSDCLRAARKTAKRIALKMSARAFLLGENEKVQDNLVTVANATNADLILLGHEDFKQSSDPEHNAETTPEPFEILKAVRANTSSSVGVVVRPDNVELPLRLEKMLLPIFTSKTTDTHEQDRAVEVMKNLALMYARAESMEVTLLHILDPADGAGHISEEIGRFTAVCTELSAIKYKNVRSNDPVGTIFKELTENRYHLLLVSGNDAEMEIPSSPFQQANCIVMFMFPGYHQLNENEHKVESIEVLSKDEVDLP
eukprot:TRINITY_DN6862_c0_g2_i2.p1 TRINITY_DN6862_c0_g2~~TRINITY_DN6862_c0_g2_i2.p1  ORF type:complete len:757 (+),score=176.25 TRINITY_DN6862_c0_g2_i2:131-2401(+)